MADLITVEQLEARLATEFSGTDLAQAEAYISDASAIVIHVAGTDFADGTPGVIVGVVAQMVRRALDNPGELTGEQIGAYGWQNQHAGSPSGGAIYVTRAERKLIREAADRPAVVTISGDTGLTDPVEDVAL
jgi:hypothetical protein